jgi:hypothetical protein
MTRALLLLRLIGIVCTTTVANAQSLESASIRSDQAEVHSVVVDAPGVISLPPVAPEAWDTWWANLPSPDRLDEERPTAEQVARASAHAAILFNNSS